MNKTAIKNFAVWARVTLINAVTQMAFEYDVVENGRNDPAQGSVNGNSLTATEKNQRSQLIAHINANGFSQTMEEAAYTWFNRFIALRFMEVNNYLPSHTRIFSDENGNFKPEVLSDAVNLELDGLDRELVLEMLENQENERLYKYIIITQCNALNEGLPEMFEEIGGWTELLFPRNLLREDSVIAKMVTDIPEDDWKDQVQIIGWLYQYYNTEPKDKVFADLKKNIKISAQAIPAATQLFTPDWIVRYMVENSLGRLWTEGHGKPDSADWKYYLDEAEQEDSVKAELAKIRAEYKNIQPEQIKFLDPCMGSGHILVYAFDVLMDIYTSCGWSERDAAKSILRHNLYGLDIDRRAYQLAYFSVMMKARQYNRRIFSPENQPNLANFADVSGVDASMVGGKVRQLAEQFKDADIYGSLMTVKAPDRIDDELSDYMPTFGLDLRQLDMMMKIYHILWQKYDVVCTNPPYMGGSGMNAKLSDYVKKNFPDSKSDLFSTFIEKGLSLVKRNGFSSMVTMQSWMFLSSFENLRVKLLNVNNITNLMHMENMVMGIAFGTAVSIFRNSHIKGYKGTYNHIKLSNLIKDEQDNDIPAAFPVMENRFAQVSTENFSKIPGMPVAYWVSEQLNEVFVLGTCLGNIAKPRQGMATTNNNLFLRLWYEIDSNKMYLHAHNRTEALNAHKKWYPYNKGGEYRKWYGNNDYLVNWEADGRDIKRYLIGKNPNIPRGESLYFNKCFSWSLISSSLPAFRFKDYGNIFDIAGMSCFSDNHLYYLLGLCNSLVALRMLTILAPTINFQAGDIANISVIVDNEKESQINDLVQDNISVSKEDWDSFEVSWDFGKHPLV